MPGFTRTELGHKPVSLAQASPGARVAGLLTAHRSHLGSLTFERSIGPSESEMRAHRAVDLSPEGIRCTTGAGETTASVMYVLP